MPSPTVISPSVASSLFEEEEDEECAWCPGSPTGRQGSDLFRRKQMRQSDLLTEDLVSKGVQNEVTSHLGDQASSATAPTVLPSDATKTVLPSDASKNPAGIAQHLLRELVDSHAAQAQEISECRAGLLLGSRQTATPLLDSSARHNQAISSAPPKASPMVPRTSIRPVSEIIGKPVSSVPKVDPIQTACSQEDQESAPKPNREPTGITQVQAQQMAKRNAELEEALEEANNQIGRLRERNKFLEALMGSPAARFQCSTPPVAQRPVSAAQVQQAAVPTRTSSYNQKMAHPTQQQPQAPGTQAVQQALLSQAHSQPLHWAARTNPQAQAQTNALSPPWQQSQIPHTLSNVPSQTWQQPQIPQSRPQTNVPSPIWQPPQIPQSQPHAISTLPSWQQQQMAQSTTNAKSPPWQRPQIPQTLSYPAAINRGKLVTAASPQQITPFLQTSNQQWGQASYQ